jgi:hypothetical protein
VLAGRVFEGQPVLCDLHAHAHVYLCTRAMQSIGVLLVGASCAWWLRCVAGCDNLL